MQFLTRAIFALAAFAVTMTNAAPTPAAEDVWAPQILSPTSNSVWVMGASETVVWDTSSKPSQVTNPRGAIYLRHNGLTDLKHPIANNVSLSDGSATIQVPTSIPAADDYQVVLFGDSGDFSDYFKIVQAYH